MSLTIKPIEIDNKNELISLVNNQLKEEPYGYQIIDRQVGTRLSGYADLVALDSKGQLYLVFILTFPQESSILMQAISNYHWACENILNLKKMYPGSNLDASLSPTLLFIGRSISSQFKRSLSFLDVPIQVLEYRAFEVNQVPCLNLESVVIEEAQSSLQDLRKEQLKREYSKGTRALSDKEIEAFVNFEGV